MEERLFDASRFGQIEIVRQILGGNPPPDVNWANPKEDNWGAIHTACLNGHDAILELLLSRDDLLVNWRTRASHTPFHLARMNARERILQLLAVDHRLDISPSSSRGSPIHWAARGGHLRILKGWIVRRRINISTDVISEARNGGSQEMINFLEMLEVDPVKTKELVRGEEAAFLFAMVVFVCDELLSLPPGSDAQAPASRFYGIATRLPLELQMVLCLRVMGSAKDIIPGRATDAAFKALANGFLR